ncbi:hypothetical protein ACLOJK_014724, partial [Asimina triloba]
RFASACSASCPSSITIRSRHQGSHGAHARIAPPNRTNRRSTEPSAEPIRQPFITSDRGQMGATHPDPPSSLVVRTQKVQQASRQNPFQEAKLKSIGNSSRKSGTNPVDLAEQLKSEANQATQLNHFSKNREILKDPEIRQMRQRTHPNGHSSSVSTSNGVCVSVKHGEIAARLSSPTRKLQHILTVEGNSKFECQAYLNHP